jgi:hypothetical protein
MEILLTVNPDGTSEIEVIGGDGKTCTDQTKALEEALGIIENCEFKPEYRQTNTHQTRICQRQ